MDYNEEYAKSLIAKVHWIWAKTYPSIPHEYIVRGKCGLSDDEFLYLVMAQREYGVHEQWHKYNFPYLYVNGYKYWTMGDAIEDTVILNRQKVFSEFDNIDPVYQDYGEQLLTDTFHLFNSTFDSQELYECGCGIGTSIPQLCVSPEKYRGVDPSKKAIEKLKESYPAYANRVFAMSFEESVNYWSKGRLVVLATFGASSYFMEQYLRILVQSGQNYFLMFYKEGYCPVCFREMHHFDYSDEALRSIFPNANIALIDNYMILSSKPFVL